MCITSLILSTTTYLVRATGNVCETFVTVKLSVVMESWVSICFFFLIMKGFARPFSCLWVLFLVAPLFLFESNDTMYLYSAPCPNWPETDAKYCLTVTEHLFSLFLVTVLFLNLESDVLSCLVVLCYFGELCDHS